MMRDLIIEKDSLRLDGNTLSVGVRMPVSYTHLTLPTNREV